MANSGNTATKNRIRFIDSPQIFSTATNRIAVFVRVQHRRDNAGGKTRRTKTGARNLGNVLRGLKMQQEKSDEQRRSTGGTGKTPGREPGPQKDVGQRPFLEGERKGGPFGLRPRPVSGDALQGAVGEAARHVG